jgi:hypothetical protein
MKKTHLLTVMAVVLATLPAFSQKPTYHWDRQENSLALVKTGPDQVEFTLWKLNLDPALKPFFHPVCAPDGTLLTAEAPPDHLWHLGLWFCWKYINKLNYWEYTGDPKNAVSEGRTALTDTKIQTRPNGAANIDLELLYHPWERPDRPVMKEMRKIRISAPGRDGGYYMDFDLLFTPLVDVLLDRTPVQTNPGGVTWGGYAGLSIRFDQKLSDPVYFSSSQDSVINGDGNSWVAANLKTPAGGTVQMVIFDNPGNPRYPSPWYTINRPNERFWFYSPAILYHEPMKLRAGQELHLRYRVLVPGKPLDRRAINKAQGSRIK